MTPERKGTLPPAPQQLMVLARARSRELLLGQRDWQAWEREMRQGVDQDAIEYWEGESC